MGIYAGRAERNLVGGRSPDEVMRERLVPHDLRCPILFHELRASHLDETNQFVDSQAVYGALTGRFYSQLYVNTPQFLRNRINENRQRDQSGHYVEAPKVSELGTQFFQAVQRLQEGDDAIEDEDHAAAIAAYRWDSLSSMTAETETAVINQVKDVYAQLRRNFPDNAAFIRECDENTQLPQKVEVLPLGVLYRLYQQMSPEVQRVARRRFNTEEIRQDFGETYEIPRRGIVYYPVRINIQPALTPVQREAMVRAEAARRAEQARLEEERRLQEAEVEAEVEVEVEAEAEAEVEAEAEAEVEAVDFDDDEMFAQENRLPEGRANVGQPDSFFAKCLKFGYKTVCNTGVYISTPFMFLLTLCVTWSFQRASVLTREFLNELLVQ